MRTVSGDGRAGWRVACSLIFLDSLCGYCVGMIAHLVLRVGSSYIFRLGVWIINAVELTEAALRGMPAMRSCLVNTEHVIMSKLMAIIPVARVV
jgi:hypothetical protein